MMQKYQSLVEDYRRIRAVSRRLHPRLTGSISGDEVYQAGRMVGQFGDEKPVIHSEQVMTALLEYTVFEIPRDGSTAIQRFGRLHSTDPDEQRYLRAACSAEYGIYEIEQRIPGVGVMARSLFADEPRLIIDMGFADTAAPGIVVACRLLCMGEYWITTGAALPMTGKQFARIRPILIEVGVKLEPGARLTPEEMAGRNRLILCAFLQSGSSDAVRYSNEPIPPTSGRTPREQTAASPAGPRPGRYDPCPCGSGRKYKFCCEKSSHPAV